MRSKKKLYPLSEVYRLLESGPVVLVTTARAGRANVTPCRIVSPPPTTVCSRSKRRWPSCTACSAMPASSPTSPICGGIPSFPNCWALNGWPVNRHCHVSFRSSTRPAATSVAFVCSGTGAWTGCPAARKVTRWTWSPHGWLHKDGRQEGVGGRLHQAGDQALFASAAGGHRRGAAGGPVTFTLSRSSGST